MKKAGIILLLFPLLAGCGKGVFSFSPYSFGSLVTDPFEAEAGEGYYVPSEKEELPYTGGVVKQTYSSLFQQGGVNYCLPSVGEQKLIVIPVDFAECPGTKDGITAIENAFFGSDDKNQYRSVSSFYEKASYGRLHLSGHVADKWFRSEKYSLADLQATKGNGNKKALTALYEEALAWYDINNPAYPSYEYSFINEFGKEMVPIYFVYNAPYSGYEGGTSDHGSMMWAFTINSPAPIAWSSYYMMHFASDKGDAHTFIHECGHLFGLDDYYDTSYTNGESDCAPLGRMDMMDCSLGDENPFTKYLMGWVTPKVVTSDCTLSMESFVSSGDFILLAPEDWNGTPYDEYYILDLYSPTHLNSTDALLRQDSLMRLPQKTGVRLYHVDARLGVFRKTGSVLDRYFDFGSIASNERIMIANNNSLARTSTGYNLSHCLIQQIDKSSNSGILSKNFIASDHIADAYVSGDQAVRDSLFYAGEGVGETFTDLAFHDGRSYTFKFNVEKLTATYATLSFSF